MLPLGVPLDTLLAEVTFHSSFSGFLHETDTLVKAVWLTFSIVKSTPHQVLWSVHPNTYNFTTLAGCSPWAPTESDTTEHKHKQKIGLYGIFLQMANLQKFKIMCLEFIHTDTCRFSSSILMCVALLAVMENQSERSLINLFVQKDTKLSFWNRRWIAWLPCHLPPLLRSHQRIPVVIRTWGWGLALLTLGLLAAPGSPVSELVKLVSNPRSLFSLPLALCLAPSCSQESSPMPVETRSIRPLTPLFMWFVIH